VPPDYLFKYTPLHDPFDRSERRQAQLDALLTSNSLWFAAPATFNDPMDCQPRYTFDGGTPEEREEFRRNTLKLLVVFNHPDAQSSQRLEFFKQYNEKYPAFNQEFYEVSHAILTNTLKNRVGVLCLSECERDPVMFYHYADRHKGMCLMFRADAFFKRAEPVQYGADYPVVDFFDDSDNPAQFEKIFLKKYEGWKYEREHRVINFNQNKFSRLTSYPIELLEGVIFGYLMPQQDRDYATSLIKQRGSAVNIYEAKVSNEHYLMDIESVESIAAKDGD
jgi:hypothetical protein